MALTLEILQGNEATAGMSEAQLAAVVELSRNDEAAVIGQRIGEIYGNMDADILGASGIAKDGTEKTYEYAKRVIGSLKSQAGDAQAQIAELTKEKARLEKAVAEGADAETKRALTKAKADLEDVSAKFVELKTKYDNAEAEHAKALFGVQIDSELAKASSGIKFKADLPAAVTGVLMQQALTKVKALNPEFIDDGNGGKVLAFSENGSTMRNPNNNLRPFTATELLTRELQAMGVLDSGRKATGAGTGEETRTTGEIADLSGARTQEEAHEIIAKQLMSQGMVNGSREFSEAMAKAWKENREITKKLPVR